METKRIEKKNNCNVWLETKKGETSRLPFIYNYCIYIT